MNTKNLNKEQTILTIANLKKRIAFNNKLNAHVRKFMKNQPYFNDYWGEPTAEMKQEMIKIFDNNILDADLSFLDTNLKIKYFRETSGIFGQVYSPSVNTYILNDLHDCEKHLKMLEQAETRTSESTDAFKIIRDLENNRLNLVFDEIPTAEERANLKHNGFKWSPHLQAWTRQLTANAEYSLKKVIAFYGNN